MQLLKNACKSLLRRFGYEIRSLANSEAEDVDFKAALTVAEAEYYARWSAPCPLFSPWLGHPDFQAIYEGAEPHTLVSPERCYILVGLARYARLLPGDFAECGVWNGGTALLLARTLGATANRKLYLFDSFQGLPKPEEKRDPWFAEGQYCADSVEKVRQVLSGYPSLIDIRRGWIPETFRGLEQQRFAFAHIDVDIYQSNLDCCAYFYPRMVGGGVLLFDEYCFAAARGEKEAVDEFFADKPERPIALPTGQAFVLKAPSAAERGCLTRNGAESHAL